MKTAAEFSRDRVHRWWLTRVWDEGQPLCAFIGLNPSTADEKQDDPTIRRCITFARSWGHGGLLMLNLFAFRSTDPRELVKAQKRGVDIVGQENYYEDIMRRVVEQFPVTRVIAAWGTGWWSERGKVLGEVARRWPSGEVRFDCLMKTKKGDPMHPLYLPSGLLPEPWNYEATL